MILSEKIIALLEQAVLKKGWPQVAVSLELPKQKEFGDFSSNLALVLAKELKKPPRVLAQELVESLSVLPDWIEKVSVAGAGFVNFYIRPSAYFQALAQIDKEKKKFGSAQIGKGKKVILEFVSANPTGPLNVVSARAGVFGDVLANFLKNIGYKVFKEFYVNDVGGQIDLFAQSIQARYLEALGEKTEIPEQGYHGEYLRGFAQRLAKKYPKKNLSLEFFKKAGLKAMLTGQKKSLKKFGVEFDQWFHQSKIAHPKNLQKSLNDLEKNGHIYKKDGAVFFKSSAFGDDKDRVVQKQDGEYTYFASDIAYHRNKFERKFDRVIDIFGPDHHGYVVRTKAAVQALGHPAGDVTILIIQQVNIIKDQEVVKMSKRAGKIITMDHLLEEVGKDVARFFFLQRSANSPLDFDMELAKKETPENPVFYIQYAHARIASIFRKAKEARIKIGLRRADFRRVDLSKLVLDEEQGLAKQALIFPDVVLRAAEELEPHLLTFYLHDLAQAFQAYYSKAKNDPQYKVINLEDLPRTEAKLYLLKNIQVVIQNGLAILGISAPEKMERQDVAGTV